MILRRCLLWSWALQEIQIFIASLGRSSRAPKGGSKCRSTAVREPNMPTRAPRICGCGYRVPSGVRCACQRKCESERPSARQRGYTTECQRESKAFLALPHNRICACGCGRTADMVDHRLAHKGDMILFWDRANWQPFNRGCNSERTWLAKVGLGMGHEEIQRISVDAERRAPHQIRQSFSSSVSLIGILLIMYFAADSISGNNVLALMLMPSSSPRSLFFADADTFVRTISIPNLFLS
jgi:5-methylcytosine-specific restriction protein A